jgi:hypothetical protein
MPAATARPARQLALIERAVGSASSRAGELAVRLACDQRGKATVASPAVAVATEAAALVRIACWRNATSPTCSPTTRDPENRDVLSLLEDRRGHVVSCRAPRRGNSTPSYGPKR